MLQSLRVWNFALLEEVAVEFGTGLNILTGETGAGKSILIDALGAILGQRISSDAIRSGCDALRVEAVFACEGDAALASLLAEQEIECEDELIILRKVARTGEVREVVLALSTTMEGDTTNFFIYRKLSAYPVRVTVIARGVSIGDELEYADEVTLGRSIINRVEFNEANKA